MTVQIISQPVVGKAFAPGIPIRALVQRMDTLKIDVTLVDEDRNAVDLTGCQIVVTAKDDEKTTLWNATVTSASDGKFTAIVQPDVVGRYELKAKVTKTNQDEVTFFIGDVVVAFEDDSTGEAQTLYSLTAYLLSLRDKVESAIAYATAMTLACGTTTTGAAGTNAKVVNSGDAKNAVFDFTIPRGTTFTPKVENGTISFSNDGGLENPTPQYIAASVTIGTVTTGEADAQASVTNAGDDQDAVLNFVIPKGATFTPAVNEDGTISFTNDGGLSNPPSVNIKGDAATVTIGTVTTGEPGTDASVSNVGTANDAVLNIAIPRGDNPEMRYSDTWLQWKLGTESETDWKNLANINLPSGGQAGQVLTSNGAGGYTWSWPGDAPVFTPTTQESDS